MKIQFLGTGTSHGVPMIGCTCAVCASENPYNKRLRTSVIVEVKEKKILIDTSIDLRQQALLHRIHHVDAVLFTHHHVDHIFGLDETRSFNRLQKKRLPCYAGAYTIEQMKKVFSYIFEYPDIPGGIPMIDFIQVDKPFTIEDVQIIPITVMHGKLPIYAYRIGDFIYATDCSGIPEASWDYFHNAEVLVLDCLRYRPHPTHFNVEQAVEAARKIGAKQTYFTHISHELDHDTVNATLPENIKLAYDGMIVESN